MEVQGYLSKVPPLTAPSPDFSFSPLVGSTPALGQQELRKEEKASSCHSEARELCLMSHDAQFAGVKTEVQGRAMPQT